MEVFTLLSTISTLIYVVMHAASYLVSTLLLHLYGASIPDDHHAALEHLKASAVLYSYRLSRRLVDAVFLMPRRHWEWAAQECIDAYVSLGQRPGLVLILLVLAILCGIVRYWVVLSVVRWETSTSTGTGVGTQCTSTAAGAVLGWVCWVAVVGYLPDFMCWILQVLELLF